MIDHVKYVLRDIKRVYPKYKGQGYTLSGFAWFQGWNDMVDSQVYPNRHKKGGYAEYSQGLANFIRDVRKDLSAPKLPFAIGVMGVGGDDVKPTQIYFRKAMAAPAKLSEFKRTVKAVSTAQFWDEELATIDKKYQQVRQMSYYLKVKHKNHVNADGKMSTAEQAKFIADYRKKLFTQKDLELEKKGKSNAGYHYMGSAKIYSLIGEALAEAVIELSNGK